MPSKLWWHKPVTSHVGRWQFQSPQCVWSQPEQISENLTQNTTVEKKKTESRGEISTEQFPGVCRVNPQGCLLTNVVFGVWGKGIVQTHGQVLFTFCPFYLTQANKTWYGHGPWVILWRVLYVYTHMSCRHPLPFRCTIVLCETLRFL